MTSLVFDSNGSYTRTVSVERDNLENKLKNIYGSQWCEITSSGTNAIFITLFTIFQNTNKKYILIPNELFGFTVSVLDMLLKTFNIEKIVFEYEDSEKLLILVNDNYDNIACMFFESCSNPCNMSINWTDRSILNRIHNLNIITIVDNTYLSPAKFNPFNYDVKIVIDSCTKYLSGGECIAGCINFKNYDNLTKKISRNVSLMGIHVSIEYLNIISQNLDTIRERILNATNRTIQIVDYLKNISGVKLIKFNQILKPCVIRFSIDTDFNTNKCKEILKELCLKYSIEYKTSFGKPTDSIDEYSKVFSNMLHIRLAIGYLIDNTFCERLHNLINELLVLVKN